MPQPTMRFCMSQSFRSPPRMKRPCLMAYTQFLGGREGEGERGGGGERGGSMPLQKITLCLGYSGIQWDTVEYK